MVAAITDEAAAAIQVIRAEELSVGAEVGAEGGILANGVLHEATSVVHLRVDDLAASPLILSERLLLNMEDLVPGAQDILISELLAQSRRLVADDILHTDVSVVDGLKDVSHWRRHFFL